MFTPTRDSALLRFREFLPRAGRSYAATRNSDFGPDNRENVSILSPWIRHRLICEEEIVRGTLRSHDFKSAEKFLQEVFWRAYFKGWLEQRPDIWRWYQSDLKSEFSRLDANRELNTRYNEAITGATGIDCFDFWARELMQTGYLHNHARMWFASIWIFTLKLPWVLGADFFYRHLLDGDPASNTCSWRWVAGLHTKGKHYVARSSNIEKFTNGRFNPVGELNETPLPLHEERIAGLAALLLHVTLPEDDYILLLHEEDCAPELLALQKPPKAIVGLHGIHQRSPIGASKQATAFAEGAVRDALSRAQEHYQCESFDLTGEPELEPLSAICDKIDIKKVVTPYVPVGPLADALDAFGQAHASNDISIHQYMRPYDEICWPHATKGFFKLKEKIPKIISELGLH